jgi:MinD superfamily P-loop ATPase
LTGVDLVLVVLEESLSGLSDYRRLATLLSHFRLPHLVVLNKVGIDAQVAKEMETAVRENGGEIAGRIPFDQSIPQALSRCETFLELPAYRPTIEAVSGQMLAMLA